MADSKTTPKLNKDIFEVEIKNHELLKLAYDAYLANSRQADATTLERGDVRGGGKKPWKQKGTGRARFGSSRNPIWRGGGVVFGPSGNENYKKKLSKTQKRLAVRQALTIANSDGKVKLIESFACPNGKVKETVKLFEDNKIKMGEKVLLVVSQKDDLVRRATRNVENLKVVSPMYLNVFDLLNVNYVVFDKKALSVVENWLIGEEK